MRTIRSRSHEHFKIRDFTFVEFESEITQDKVEEKDTQAVQEELDQLVGARMKAWRKEFKKAFNNGAFDI